MMLTKIILIKVIDIKTVIIVNLIFFSLMLVFFFFLIKTVNLNNYGVWVAENWPFIFKK